MIPETPRPRLFPETAEERVERIDAEILALLIGKPGGKFGETLGAKEKAVLAAIRYQRGHQNAIKIDRIQGLTHLDGRAIKGIVRRLRVGFRLPIGSWKHSEKGGYYICVTREDIENLKRDVWEQIRAEFDVLRVAATEEDALEMVAQLRAEVTG